MSDVKFLLAVIVLDVVLRLPLLALDVVPTSDFEWYFDAARSIAAGGGFADKGVLTAFWPVGWPAFVGGLFWMFGPSLWIGQIANLALSAGVVGLMPTVGRAMFPASTAWRLGALLIAVFPNQIAYDPLMSVEIFFEFLVLLGFLLLVHPPRRSVVRDDSPGWPNNLAPDTVGALVLSGLVFGLASLTKTQAVLLPSVLALPLLAHGISRWLRTVALTGLVMAAVILPWTARNYSIFHAFIPVSTNGGYTLLTGNNPAARGGYTVDDALVSDLSRDPRDQVAMDRLARERAWDWIAAHPVGFIRLIPLKLWRLWAGDGEAEWLYQSGYAGYSQHVILFRAVRVANQLYYTLIVCLAAASLPAMWRQRRALPIWSWSGWLAIGYFSAISAIFSGQSRFHFALMPFVALYAAWRVTKHQPMQSF